MSKTSYPLKLPQSIKAAAARLAKEDGVSLNQWIAVAVAEKLGVPALRRSQFGMKCSPRAAQPLEIFRPKSSEPPWRPPG